MGELKVVTPPSRDGGVIGRVVSDDVDSWAETWRGPERGWVEGGMDIAGVMRAAPVSSEALREAGIPEEPPPEDAGW